MSSGVVKGIILGTINVFVISFGFAAIGGLDLGVLCAVFGAIPGVIAGAVLGLVASALKKQHVLLRVAVLVVPAVATVFWLAHEFDMMDAAKVSSVPTIILGLLLERWTRHVPEAPPIPVARVGVTA